MTLRVALCHEWITTYGGSEIVAATIADALDVNDVYSFAVEPRLSEELFPGRSVKAVAGSAQGRIGIHSWRWMLPVMPRAWRGLDLSDYDLIVTSSHACVNAIDPPPGTPVLSYCHTPMRYAWEWRTEIRRVPAPVRPLWPLIASQLQRQDRQWSRHVTQYVANSRNVARRIHAYYGRDAIVIYPPIDTDYWTPGAEEEEGFFLLAGRQVPYKRPDLVVEAATRAGVSLVVAGSGPELPRLKKIAGRSVTFEENPSRDRLRTLYRQAQALVFAGIEDFGMTLVEAQACGTPVIAYAAGGALESVVPDQTGLLFHKQSVIELGRLLSAFSASAEMRAAARSHAVRFDRSHFISRMATVAREVGESS